MGLSWASPVTLTAVLLVLGLSSEPPLAASQSAPAGNVAPVAVHKRFEYKYSFKPPYLAQKDGSVSFWEDSGRKFIKEPSTWTLDVVKFERSL